MKGKSGPYTFQGRTKQNLMRQAEPEYRTGKAMTEPKPIRSDQWEKIARALRFGGDLKMAAALARISYKRLCRNIDAETHMRRDVQEIMAKCKLHHLKRIYNGDKGWQSSAWFLERIYRKEFAMINQDQTEEEKAIQVRKIVRRQGPLPKGAETAN